MGGVKRSMMGTSKATGTIKQSEGTSASNVYSPLRKSMVEHCYVATAILIDQSLVKVIRQPEIWNILRFEYRHICIRKKWLTENKLITFYFSCGNITFPE